MSLGEQRLPLPVGSPHAVRRRLRVFRGGPPLQSPEDPMDLNPAMCPQPWSPASSAYCTLVEWHRIERKLLVDAGKADPFTDGSRLPASIRRMS